MNYVPAAPDTRNIHPQIHDDLLLVVNGKEMFAASEFQDECAYYSGALGQKVGTASQPSISRHRRAGLAFYDVSKGDAPREIGFMSVDGIHSV